VSHGTIKFTKQIVNQSPVILYFYMHGIINKTALF
jgi:hypothetical protein